MTKHSRPILLGITLFLLTGAHPMVRGPWIEAKRDHYSVFYQAGFDGDAQLAQRWADDAERLMKEKYGVVPTHYRMSIYLQPAPTAGADISTARNHCCQAASASDSTGTIEMLAPSAPAMKTVSAISSLGMPKNSDDYHAKVLISEYIPIGHYEAQNSRASGGWKYYSAPNWFMQGLQEYDAIFHSTPANRDVSVKRLSAWVTSHPAVFSCCAPDLAIGDDYNGGATFMAFLAVQFGEGVHSRLLHSQAPAFAEALTEVTKPYSRAELFQLFQQWIEKGAPAGSRQEPLTAASRSAHEVPGEDWDDLPHEPGHPIARPQQQV